jgi:hypothetical protein
MSKDCITMTDLNLRDAWDAAIKQLRTDHCADGFIKLHIDGHLTGFEMLDAICKNCFDTDSLSTVARRMRAHPDDWVRKIATNIEDIIVRRTDRITDIARIETTSPLQPGCRIRLNGSYDQANWWLNGKDYYDATFVRFAERKHGEMPVAIIEFDIYIDMTEFCGQIHRGKFGLMKLQYVSDWNSSETVWVYIIDEVPNDFGEFYFHHPFGTEIESHATYTLLTAFGA